MSATNLVSATLTPESRAAVLAAIQTIRQNLPFLIDLSAAQRRKLFKMGDGSRAFVENALMGAQANPQLFPPSFDLAEFARDWVLREEVLMIQAQVNQLHELLDDTAVALGSDLMTTATLGYRYLGADPHAGNDSLRALLAARFKPSSGSGSAAPEPAASGPA